MMRSAHLSILILAALPLLAACDQHEGDAAAAERSAAGEALAPVVEAAAEQHPGLHAADGGEGAPGALVRRFIDQEEGALQARRQLLDKAGPCRFVCAGALTPLGKALLAALDELAWHELDPAAYGMPALKERVDAFSNARKDAVKLPPEAGPAGRVLLEHLARRQLDRDALTRDLLAAGGQPTEAHVGFIADQLREIAKNEEIQRDEARLEADLGRALLRYVVDMRFAIYGGPQEPTRDVNKLIEERQDEIVDATLRVIEANDPAAALRKLEPASAEYRRLLQLRDTYRALVDKGGCAGIPKNWSYQKGVKPGYEVVKLKERLKCEGYYDGPTSEEYSDLLRDAVKRYQRHHDLDETGYVGEDDLRSLNVEMKERAAQLALGAIRLREAREDELGDFYLRVNIPEFALDVVEFGKPIRRQRVIVGTNKLDDNKLKLLQGHINRTPLLRTELHQVVINPDWILPTRVQKGEVIGHMEKNKNYMEENNIKKITLDSGREVLVQERGDDNVLGAVKFNLRNSNAIFLHDTNDPYLFNYRYRALSHGCMRVQDAPAFARWLLLRDGWNEAEIEDAFKRKSAQRGMNLKTSIPFISVYRTVALSDEDLPIFLGDVYRYDRAFADNELPPLEQVRWGDSRLRPPWVPRVPEELVNQWRAEGKPAPRDYKPPKEEGGKDKDADKDKKDDKKGDKAKDAEKGKKGDKDKKSDKKDDKKGDKGKKNKP